MVKYSDTSALQYNRMEPIRLLTGHSPLVVLTLKLHEWAPVRAYRSYTKYIASFPAVALLPSSGPSFFYLIDL